MILQDLKKFKITDKPGVYFFKKGKNILYIGKATSLRDRLRSYFANDLIKTRGPRVIDMVTIADAVDFNETESVLEALILESNLIKKHQPKYNIQEKDDKSYNFVVITNEDFPMVYVERGRTIEFETAESRRKFKYIFGPYPLGNELREALKIIRKIFPFRALKQMSNLYQQIGLEPLLDNHSDKEKQIQAKKEYARTINHIRLFFEGKKKQIERELKKQMMAHAKKQEFELAERAKRKLFALQHIRDISLLKRENFSEMQENFRVEAYDIAHLSGSNTVGVMTVLENGIPHKSAYRKFIIRTARKSDDCGALKELLERRFNHTEWTFPNLIVIDGGKGQRSVAEEILSSRNLKIPIVNVVKDERHKPKSLLGSETLVKRHKKEILIANSEAHRFAISFLRNKQKLR